MKKVALKVGTRVKLIKYAMGHNEGSIFIIDQLWNYSEKSYEYLVYVETNSSKTYTLFDDEFVVI